MSLRQEKTSEFFVQHMETFRKLGIIDPFFVIKTAFFQKGKYGRQVQFFEWELKKGEDIYVEFYDNVADSGGKTIDYKPFHQDRLLCKYKVNPHFAEEYEKKENINQSTGEPYFTYTVPLAEMIAINLDGREMSYPMYEKAKESPSKEEVVMPRLQNSLVFPDFEEEMIKKPELVKEPTLEDLLVGDDSPISDMTITDFAAIMWKKPVSNKSWLNSLIEKQ
jgi:hypothetical protein